MRLTLQANYAVRALMYCTANPDKPSKVPEIAATYGISETHLFKVMKVLVDNGFIKTIRGRNGGILLARPADEISIGEVIRAAEENFNLAECFDPTKRDCPLIDSCKFNRVLNEALQAFFGVLDLYTVADLSGDQGQLRMLLSLEAMHPMMQAAKLS
ncbi:iron-responsive transcriptional regulator RirA [Breoghania sp. L-A4]|uniref:iron-responsive transcriptional regulator RirA n=1 Tax=Breoghania sp. L-A4 TaxID=2304600 RepID=UPI000E35CCDC|nr:iron-responsive transcriptional regulator RirA [Breoghania sp. L-A4]AXS40948.1 iron-responsive transcriptional regulator RirA [Breoghania sp. L-A4]